MNINDYFLVNKTHYLDAYKVTIPIWNGSGNTFAPFESWKKDNCSPAWYKAYNDCKHDRQEKFKSANFGNLLNSVAGLFVLLSSQFRTEVFSPGSRGLAVSVPDYYSGCAGIGGFFRVEFPNNWLEEEKYDFDWSKLQNSSDKFAKFDYDALADR